MEYRSIVFAVVALAMFPVTGAPAEPDSMAMVRSSIIERCRNQMGNFGASTVKFCVDQDLSAYTALSSYDAKHQSIIARRKSQMLSMGGWTTVKFCADEDIEAERALEGY